MPENFCFYHAADLHLDTPFGGLEQVAPELAEALREASLQAFDALIEQVIGDEAAFLLLAGDIYDGAQRGLRAQFRVQAGLQRLSQAGIPAFIVHGNHDPLGGWSGIRVWPAGVHVFGAAEVSAVPVVRGGAPIATVHGISYPTAHVHENLARRFRRGTGPGLQIGLLHANVEGNADHAPYAPCTLDDLRAAGMDYWALGHVHARQVLAAGPTWVVYPGNLQGRSPKPSERGPKGAVRVEVVGGVVRDVVFVPLDRFRFVALDVDATALADLGALRQALAEGAEALAEAHAGRGLLIRARVHGKPSFHGDLLRPDAGSVLLRDLRDASEGRRPHLWWEALRLETRAPLDHAALREGQDFTGELLRMADQLRVDSAALAALAARVDRPLPPTGGGEPADWQNLLDEAEALALDLLQA